VGSRSPCAPTTSWAVLAIDDGGVDARFTAASVASTDPAGLVARFERPLARLAEWAVECDALAERAARALAQATAVGAPFERADRLRHLERRKGEIEATFAPPPGSAPAEEPFSPHQRAAT
jgi:hypothetical protein